jgi:hypothetical protein
MVLTSRERGRLTSLRATALAFALISGPAFAADEVLYAAAPGWVIAAPQPTGTVALAGPLQFAYLDYQVYAGPDGDELYTASRTRILAPEGLAAGNITLTWSPDSGDATVHHLRILRDGQQIDVLESTKFEVLRREEFLQDAVLTGRLTAVMQVPGLRVGDELEVAATVRRRDPTLGEHSFGFVQLPMVGMPGAFRARLLWPESRSLTWRATSDVQTVQETREAGRKELVYDLRDPSSVVLADGAPLRVNLRRLIEFSDFASWDEVSRRVAPLFEEASELPRDSTLHQEIAAIARSTNDPVRRAEAALQLVQERIRYVYVGLDGGNLRPATAAETWTRRFGDCKAKTALLLAILDDLDIAAEPVLVHSLGGDGANERLPSPGLFDHVLVRAKIGNTVHWLDGTRIGDRSLAAISPPPYKWVLPLRREGANLEAVPSTRPAVPQRITVIEVDASGGFEQRASVKAHLIMRGAEAYATRSQLSALSAQDAERSVRTFWEQGYGSIEADTASWKYDEQMAVLRLSVEGTIKLEWKGGERQGYNLDIFGAGFFPPNEYRRPREQDQTAPWLTDHPAYTCWATAIRLPQSSPSWKWEYRANPVNRTMGGMTYWRTSDLREGVVRTIMSRRADVPEISADEAQEVNRLLPTFDNNVSQVYQINANTLGTTRIPLAEAPFGEQTDWMSPRAPCGVPPEATN